MATCLVKGVRFFTFLFFKYFLNFFPFGYLLENQIICYFKRATLYSRGYVYCFCHMLQGLRLFNGLRFFQTLEYSSSQWLSIYEKLYFFSKQMWKKESLTFDFSSLLFFVICTGLIGFLFTLLLGTLMSFLGSQVVSPSPDSDPDKGG